MSKPLRLLVAKDGRVHFLTTSCDVAVGGSE
jgi:hypothetical protein